MNTGARAAASAHKSKGCDFSCAERVVGTACNDDDVSNRTLALVSVKNHHGNSEFLCSEQSGASKHAQRKAKNLSIVRLRLMAVPVTLELEGAVALSSSSSSGPFSLSKSKMVCSSIVSQHAAGVSAGWSAWEMKSWLASCVSCASATSRSKSTPDSQLTFFHAEFRGSILFWMWSVAFSAHTTLLLFRCMREKSNVVLMFWPSTTLSAKLSLAAAVSTDFHVLNMATSQGWQYDVDWVGMYTM